MSGWISSKIKAAENLLHQIDQQAAESLGKSEVSANIPFSQNNIPFSQNDVTEQSRDTGVKSINLPKKKPSFSQLQPQKPLIGTSTSTGTGTSTSFSKNETLDADWTELLNSPSKPIKKDININIPKEILQTSAIKIERETQIEPNKLNNEKKLEYSESESDSNSDSSYDSEEERERREEIAKNAILERETLVERLKREKESLERILREREKEQAKLATELQVNTNETIEAVEIEKIKHNNTRLDALARVTKLEGVNAELSKVLATTQWNLELEVNRVAELREKIEMKEAAQKEYRRKMSNIQSSSTLGDEMKSLKRFKLEIFDAEYSFISDKITKLKDKAKNIEENIKTIKREIENHSELENELEKRLDQLSDQLIHKQMQVESLASEKATLHLRIEMVSRLIDSSFDIESGTSSQKTKQEKATGRLQLINQLESLFGAGLVFLKRNPSAQLYAVLYLVCLHVWVLYIFMSNSRVYEDKDGAVISLASINRTASS